MSYLIMQFAIAIAVVINLIVWYHEWHSSKIIKLCLDISGTYGLVIVSGGGMIMTAAILYASLIWSAFLWRTKMWDFDRIKGKGKRVFAIGGSIFILVVILKTVVI